MGCDIHLYAEKRRKEKGHWDSDWSSVHDLSNSGIRDYDMFGFLAKGVRFTPDEEYEPHEANGLPDDVNFMTPKATDPSGDFEIIDEFALEEKIEEIEKKTGKKVMSKVLTLFKLNLEEDKDV